MQATAPTPISPMKMTSLVLGWLLLSLFACVVHAEDQRWPDFGITAQHDGSAGAPSYFQGFESACFNAPYQPGAGATDWVRFYSEIVRVGTGSGGIASRNGFNHAEIRPPLPTAPAPTTGAFTRLGGYSSNFGAGFVVELDVFFDLTDPRVVSGVNAAYGWDAASAVNNREGGFRRDFVFHAANNSSGQILVGASNITNFAPRGNLASGAHYVVASSGWYTLQWVYRDAGNGTLAGDLRLRNQAGNLLFMQTLNNPEDVIATSVGGNRYLWLTFVESARLPIDNARLNSGVLDALYASMPPPGSVLNAGRANPGNPAAGTRLNILSQGTLRLEVCACELSGPGAADYSVSNCPTEIAPGSSASIGILCTPTAAGARNAVLTVRTNDSLQGTDFSYPLQCTGDPDFLFANGFE